MARFARIDSRESFQDSRAEPFVCELLFGGLNIANDRRFEAIRANRSGVMKVGFAQQINLRESIHTNRPDSRCESLGHVSAGHV